MHNWYNLINSNTLTNVVTYDNVYNVRDRNTLKDWTNEDNVLTAITYM